MNNVVVDGPIIGGKSAVNSGKWAIGILRLIQVKCLKTRINITFIEF